MIQQRKRKQKQKQKKLKTEDFRHAGNENKQSRQNHQNIFYSSTQKSKWAIEEKLMIGAKFTLYHLYWEYLDMEKQNKLLQDRLISKCYFINLTANSKIKL